jgi:uncharacterized membrane protein
MSSEDDNPDLALPAQPAAVTAAAPVPWELVLARSWRKLALTFTAALSVASVAWQVTHRDLVYPLVFRPAEIAGGPAAPRQALVVLAVIGALVAAAFCVPVLRRVRRGGPVGPFHREVLVTSLLPLPLLLVPTLEFEHPLFTGTIVILFSLALAWTVSRETAGLRAPRELTRRQAMLLVAAGMVVFAGTIGFLSYWRYITFHAQLCDSTWETNSVWGIVHHGIPTISVSAFMYEGKPLPQPYFNDHVPFADYLYAPFFAVYQDARTLVWMQAVFMSTGAIGAYLIGRRWLGTRLAGVMAAWVYVLNPSVQSYCLHDIHPNILVIPSLLLAVGLMESKRPRAAMAFAVLAAICHEETPMYAAALGLYWMFSGEGEDRQRFRLGLGLGVLSLALVVLFSAVLMPAFGGEPRWGHFDFFFDHHRSAGSLVGALVLNPLGAALSSTSDLKIDFVAITIIPLGAMALFGFRAGWFLLPVLLLLVPSSDVAFFCPGMNYSAPLVPAVLLMSLAGVRRWWGAGSEAAPGRRAGVAAFVLGAALIGNFLYGNIASKSYKLEYGYHPLRRENQHHYRYMMGYVDELPPFGPVERDLWKVIHKVPPRVPVLSSWAINPQIASRDVSLAFGYSGGHPPPEERVDYIVIDKLPAMQVANEPYILRFRKDARFSVFYENSAGIIFKRLR